MHESACGTPDDGTREVWVGYGARFRGLLRVGVSRSDVGMTAPWTGSLPNGLEDQWRVETEYRRNPSGGICFGLPTAVWRRRGAARLSAINADVVGFFADVSSGTDIPSSEPWASRERELRRLLAILRSDDGLDRIRLQL